jgi:predicted aspartyl protease
MPRGRFVNNCPCIVVVVEGPLGSQEVEVIIDSGDGGSLTLPEEIAQRIGLSEVYSIGYATMANGSASSCRGYSDGTVIYNNTRVHTVIDVLTDRKDEHSKSKILMGMDLLSELGLSLFIDLKADRVELDVSETQQHNLKKPEKTGR